MTEARTPLLQLQAVPRQHQRVPLDLIDGADCSGAPSTAVKGSMQHLGELDDIDLETLPSGRYRVLDGRRRVTRARELGWTDIGANVYETLTPELRALIAIGKHARSANPLDELRHIQQLERAGHDEASIARLTGMGVGTVRARKKLATLPADVLDQVAAGKLALGIAKDVADLKEPYLGRAVAEIRALSSDAKKKFGRAELKSVTTARKGDLLGRLSGALTQAPLLAADPLPGLVAEVRSLAALRGVNLTDLARALTPAPAFVQDQSDWTHLN